MQDEKHAIAECLAKKEEEQQIKKQTEQYAKMMDDVVNDLKRMKEKEHQ